jgi:hypothetical protein
MWYEVGRKKLLLGRKKVEDSRTENPWKKKIGD